MHAPLGPTLAGLTLEGILGGMVVVEIRRRAGTLWTLPWPLLSATWAVDPLRGRAIQFWGCQWLVSGSWIVDPLWERAVRSIGSGWSRGDCFTCWRCGAWDRLWSQVRLCLFSTGGCAHGSGRSHDELSAIRAVVQRGGITPEDSIPWVFGDGFILRPVSTSCWLAECQFFGWPGSSDASSDSGQAWRVAGDPLARSPEVESRRSCQDNPSRREESLGGGGGGGGAPGPMSGPTGHFFRLEGRGVFHGN